MSNNNSVKNILRDLVGISSFLSVIFIIHLKSDDKKVENIFKILIITGLIFSIKVFIFSSFFLDHVNYPEDDPIQVSKFHFLYLENTIILCLLFFIFKIYEKIEKQKLLEVIKYTILSFFPLFVVTSYSLRGPILFCLCVMFYYLIIHKKNYKNLFFLIAFILSLTNIFFGFFFFILYYFYYNRKINLFNIITVIAIFLFIFDHIFLYAAEISRITHNYSIIQHILSKFQINLFKLNKTN